MTLARRFATWHNNPESLSNNSGCKCLQVMPDGPGAAPRLALLKFRQKVSSSRSNGRAGVSVIILGGSGSLGAASRRSTCSCPSCRLQRLSCRRNFGCAPIWTWSPPLPDARRQCLPRDTLSVEDQFQPIASKEFLEPRLQLLPWDQLKNMRGRRKKSFHPRPCFTSSRWSDPDMISSRRCAHHLRSALEHPCPSLSVSDSSNRIWPGLGRFWTSVLDPW